MSPSRFWAKPAAVALACLATLSAVLVTSGHGKATRVVAAGQEVAAPKLDRAIFGAAHCRTCHSAGAEAYLAPFQPKNKKTAKAEATVPALVCLMDEYVTWSDRDKHTQAYAVLSEDRAKRMGRLLWGDEDVTGKAECLGCHATPADPQRGLRAGLGFNLAEGVTCVACHGASSNWVLAHVDPTKPDWKALNREQKETLQGMTDLWDAATRTEVCASCHIGNKPEGKFLTHAMYAAGHPPLPSFETETFSSAEPQHWREVRDKSPEVRKLQQFHGFDPAQSERIKLLAIGQAAALRDAIRLLADDAADKAKAARPRDRSLDLTHFDCYACHHDLNYPGIRQARGYAGSAGRPQPRPWPTALMPLVLHAAYADEAAFRKASREFEANFVRYLQPFEDRPFGVPAAVVAGSEPIAAWLDRLIKDLGAAKYDESAALRMLHHLCATARGDSGSKELFDAADYDSARQLAWAFDVIYAEWLLLRKEGQQPNPAADRIATLLAQLKEQLRLDLPSGVDRLIVGELPGILKTVADFDPALFRARMAELDSLVENN